MAYSFCFYPFIVCIRLILFLLARWLRLCRFCLFYAYLSCIHERYPVSGFHLSPYVCLQLFRLHQAESERILHILIQEKSILQKTEEAGANVPEINKSIHYCFKMNSGWIVCSHGAYGIRTRGLNNANVTRSQPVSYTHLRAPRDP